MTSLMLHTGAVKVDREALEKVATPEATETYQPISHGSLVDRVIESMTRRGFSVDSEEYGLSRDGARLFGVLGISHPALAQDGQYALQLGLRNSHDKSFPAAGLLGSRVFVCDNLAFSGEVQFKRKHTPNLGRDLPGVVDRAVEKIIDMRQWQERRIEAYRRTELTEPKVHDIVVRALDRGIVPVTKVPALLSEWRKPSFDQFQERTAWSLFNAFTFVLKGNQQALPGRTVALHSLLDGELGIEVAAPLDLSEPAPREDVAALGLIPA